MIEIKLSGMCEGCAEGEITVKRYSFVDGMPIYTAHCEHQEACERMNAKLNGEGER